MHRQNLKRKDMKKALNTSLMHCYFIIVVTFTIYKHDNPVWILQDHCGVMDNVHIKAAWLGLTGL